MESSIKILGQKIILRDWTLDDLTIWEYWQQPYHEWHKTDGPYYNLPSLKEITKRVEEIKKKIKDNQFSTPRNDFIISEYDSDKLIGRVSWYWQSKETNWLSVGIVIYDPSKWQQGIGFEALGLWSEYLFNSFPEIVRLDLRTWSGNFGMMRLAEKVGYIQEACFRKARIVVGQYYDGLGYGILREEWMEKYPGGFGHKLLIKP